MPTDLHKKRVDSLANATQGVIAAASLSVTAIGSGYAVLNGGDPKHGVKQVDRMLSNAGIDLPEILAELCVHAIGERKQVEVALDWTSFDNDKQSTLVAGIVEDGRSTPLFWQTVADAELSDGGRTDAETELLHRLHEVWPEDVQIILLADRGFGDSALYELLQEWGWDFVIRFKQGITVHHRGKSQAAKKYLSKTGRARLLRNVQVTGKKVAIPGVVVVKDRDMKHSWCLATTLVDDGATRPVKAYGRRFTIEEMFRDMKDERFGFGMRQRHVSSPESRDKLILLFALAQALLILLGEASELAGYDRRLRVNTSNRRTHSLFRQGQYCFDALPALSEEKAAPLLAAFAVVVQQHELTRQLLMPDTPAGEQ